MNRLISISSRHVQIGDSWFGSRVRRVIKLSWLVSGPLPVATTRSRVTQGMSARVSTEESRI